MGLEEMKCFQFSVAIVDLYFNVALIPFDCRMGGDLGSR